MADPRLRQALIAVGLMVGFGSILYMVPVFALPSSYGGSRNLQSSVQNEMASLKDVSAISAEDDLGVTVAPAALGLASVLVVLATSATSGRSAKGRSLRRVAITAMRATKTEEAEALAEMLKGKEKAAKVAAAEESAEVAASTTAKEEEEEAPVKEAPEKRIFDPARQVGITEPLGFFDPLGFTKKGDKQGFRNLREAELKHGRVAMMASAGLVLPYFYEFPFFELPPGIYAPTETPGREGLATLVLLSGILELTAFRQRDDRNIGDFGDPLGFNIYDRDMRNRELNNGRLAMFTSVGMIVAELVSGKDAMQQLGLPEKLFLPQD